MAGKPGLLLKLFAGVIVVMLTSLACATWFFFMRPLTLDALFSRLALGQTGLERNRIESPAGRLTHFTGGHGPTVFLLHGAGEQAGEWARIVTPIIEEYSLVLPDLAGHGGSDPSEGPITVDGVLDGLEALARAHCGDGAVSVVGRGLGARLAFLWARRHPERIAHIVAVNGGPLPAPEGAVGLEPTTPEEARTMMEGLMGGSAESIPGHVLADIVRRSREGPAARLAASARRPEFFFSVDELTTFATRVDLVWGDEDELFDLDSAHALLSALPSAELRVVAGCGHFPQRECPVETSRALLSVLGGEETSALP